MALPPPLAALRHFPFPALLSPAATTASRARTAVAFSLQTNVRLLKPNRRSRRSRYPYYDLGEEDGEEFEEEEDDQGYETDDDLSGLEYPGQRTTPLKENREGRRPKTHGRYGSPEKSNSLHPRSNVGRSSIGMDSKVELKNESMSRSLFQKLQEEYDFDDKWLPLIDYLCTFGVKESHFTYIYERHMACFQTSWASAEERLEFLLGAGVKSKDMKRMLVRQPQILEYTQQSEVSRCFSGGHWCSKCTDSTNYFCCSFIVILQC